MKYAVLNVMLFCLLTGLAGCDADKSSEQPDYEKPGVESADAYQEEGKDFMKEDGNVGEAYTVDTKISEVIGDPVFGDYGRLIFPVDSGYYSGDTLGTLGLTWYSNIDPEKTVEIVNYMRDHALAGETVFYDIYTDKEKAADLEKEDTGLFFFRGSPGEKFAVLHWSTKIGHLNCIF